MKKYTQTALFLLTRTYFNELIAAFPDVDFYNCSDGAFLEGAIPTLPIKLGLDDNLPDVKQLITNYHTSLSRSGFEVDKNTDIINAYSTSLMEWYRSVIAILKLNWQGKCYREFYDKLAPLLQKTDGHNNFEQAAITCNAGTVMMMVQFGYAYRRRIEKDQKTAFMALFCEEMINIIGIMENEIDTLLSEHKP